MLNEAALCQHGDLKMKYVVRMNRRYHVVYLDSASEISNRRIDDDACIDKSNAVEIGETNNEVYRDKYPTIRSDWSRKEMSLLNGLLWTGL